MPIFESNLPSRLLGKTIRYQILSPASRFGSGALDFRPVLYLLHGLFGAASNFTELTELTAWTAGSNVTIVSFDAGDCWYTDGIDGQTAQAESFIIRELIPKIERQHLIGGSRSARVIAGLSMGGYGAFKLALKYPFCFAWAGSLSGAFAAPSQSVEQPGPDWEIIGDSINAVFGEASHSARRHSNDLFRIVSRMSKHKRRQLPKLYFDCGTDDSFIDVNRELFEVFQAHKIDSVFVEKPGGHNWEYWNRQLFEVISRVEKLFGKTTGPF